MERGGGRWENCYKFQPCGGGGVGGGLKLGGGVGGCRTGSKIQRLCLGNWVCKSSNASDEYA